MKSEARRWYWFTPENGELLLKTKEKTAAESGWGQLIFQTFVTYTFRERIER